MTTFRFDDTLQSINDFHTSIRAGGTYRDSNGLIWEWCTIKPDPVEVIQAKAKANRQSGRWTSQAAAGKASRTGSFDTTCPCCHTHYRLPSVFVSICKHGVCTYCEPFVNGEDDGFILKRAPTLTEALATPDPRQADAHVMKAALQSKIGA